MDLLVVVALAALFGSTLMYGIGRVLRRDYNEANGPLPALTRTLRYRAIGGQDPIAVAIALNHAGFRTIERFVRGDHLLVIAVSTGSTSEREAVRSIIFNAPTLEGAEYHPDPAVVVFVDEES